MATISKKRPPQSPAPELQRVVQQIYDDLNEVINAVNQKSEAGAKETEGKVGSIRLSKEDNTERYVEFRFKDGWRKIKLE